MEDRIKIFLRTFLLCLVVVSYSCDDEAYVVVEYSPVNYNINEMPYENLSQYNFFQGELKNLDPVFGVIPYELISSLFTDYSIKNRFLWMPDGVSAEYISNSSVFDFPVGTILIKNFSYDDVLPEMISKNIETRLMIKKENGWIFADYIWNEDQTEASFSLEGSVVDISWLQNGEERNISYRIPSASECLTCHKISDGAIPNGVKPRNINKTLDYRANSMNQLDKWMEMGYLNSYPSDLEAVANWKDLSEPLEKRVRSYIDINCAHCHSENTHCEYRPIRLSFEATEDLANMGVCLTPDTNLGNGTDLIINPGNIDRSVLHFRMTSNEEQYRMPLIGRSIVHDEAIAMIEEWINSLNNCN
tara:strand:- start:485 stop:1564 length:1080 start_codon:yes stop_codon:yes gene_type:complete